MDPRRDLHPDELRWLRALALRLLEDPHRVDDAVQDTLVAALTGAPRRTAAARRGWLSSNVG